jgi:hypothetical protein
MGRFEPSIRFEVVSVVAVDCPVSAGAFRIIDKKIERAEKNLRHNPGIGTDNGSFREIVTC